MALHYAPAELQMPFAGGPTDATEFPVRCAMRAVELARQFGSCRCLVRLARLAERWMWDAPSAGRRSNWPGLTAVWSPSITASDSSRLPVSSLSAAAFDMATRRGRHHHRGRGHRAKRHQFHSRHIPGRRRLRPPHAGPVRSSVRRQPPLPFTAPTPLPRSHGEPIRPRPPRRITIHHNPLHLDGNLHPPSKSG